MMEMIDKRIMEMKDEAERVKLEERLKKIVDEKMTGFGAGLLSKITKVKQEIAQIKGVTEENKVKMLKLEGKYELLMDKNIQTLLLQQMKIQLETKDKGETHVKKLNEEKVELEEEVGRLKVKLDEMEKKGDGFKAKPEVRNVIQTFVHKMTSFDLINRVGIFQPHNDPSERDALFKLNGYPVLGLVEPLYGNSKHPAIPFLSLQLEIQNPETFRAKFPLIPNVYYLLKDKGPGHFSPIREPICLKAFCLFGTFFKLNRNYEAKSECDDISSKAFEIYVEPPSLAQTVHSYDGSLDWTIDHYAQRKRMERKRFIEYQESPYFYTGPRGYRVQLHVYLNGFGENKIDGLMAQINFLSGEFDEGLSPDFAHRTTITLINQLDPAYNVTKMVEKNIADEKSYLVDLCDVREMLYALENDALLIKVTIKAISN